MLLNFRFRSCELNKNTSVHVIIPDGDANDAPCKTLWLLHGLKGDDRSWLDNTLIERYAKRHNLAVVMPNADRSWYTNTAYGVNYFDYIANELPALCRRTFRFLSEKREDNIVAGLSMGGYGALKLALTYPERYASCISLSGSLDVTRKGRPCNLPEWRSIFGLDMKAPDELEGSQHDLFSLVTKNKLAGVEFPKIYLWCGTEDRVLGGNERFACHLSEQGVAHTYETSEGDHSWKWWDLHIQDGLRFALEEEQV